MATGLEITSRMCFPVRECRDVILGMSASLAKIVDNVIQQNNPVPSAAALLADLIQLSAISGLSLRNSIFHKLKLNELKYPVNLCKVRIYCRPQVFTS